MSPDNRTLYLVESHTGEGKFRRITAYDLTPEGRLLNPRIFHNFYPGRSADGLCVDRVGNVYAAAGLIRPRRTSETLDTKAGIYVFSPGGKLARFLPVWEDLITNCTIGGPDGNTLYVTAGKHLLRAPVPVLVTSIPE